MLLFLFCVLHLWSLPSEATDAGCALAGLASQEATVEWGSLYAQILPVGKRRGEKKVTMEVRLNSLCIDIRIGLSIQGKKGIVLFESLQFISKMENSMNRQDLALFSLHPLHEKSLLQELLLQAAAYHSLREHGICRDHGQGDWKYPSALS